MSSQKIILFGVIVLFFISCKNNKQNETAEKLFYKERGIGSYDDKLHMPIDINGNIDTTDAPKIRFTSSSFVFDTIKMGDIIKHEYNFTNTGNRNLYVLDVKTSCGCTVPSFDKDAIAPGENGVITATFDSKDRKGIQEKSIKVFTNTYPNKSELTLTGFIKS